MGKLISISIDLAKLNKELIQTTDKNGQPFKNGAKYYNLTVSLNDEKDKFGNDVAVYDQQTKEDREQGNKKNYIGNGKVFWSSDKPVQQQINKSENLPF